MDNARRKAERLYEELAFMAPEAVDAKLIKIEDFLYGTFSDGEEAGYELAIAKLRSFVESMPKWDKRTVPGGFHVHRQEVLDYLNELENLGVE